jgi:phosphoenolpyruvate-protein kinase (PTS system EI component)
MNEVLRGLGASAGVATGPAYRLADPPRLPPPRPVTDPDAELDRAYAAIDGVRRDIGDRAAAAVEPTTAEILRVQAALAGDRILREGVAMAVRAGHQAPHAVAAVLAEHRSALLAAGGLLAARAADLDDLRDRAVAHCLGLPMPALPDAELTGGTAEGVGLFRTELLFQHHLDAPSEAEQTAAYAEVFRALPDLPVIVRTLDAGADKPLSRFPQTLPGPGLGRAVHGLPVCLVQ